MNRFSKTSQNTAILLGAVSLLFTAGCSTKNYVRSQTAPLITKTNELDDATAANNRAIQSTNDRAQQGIQQAQQSANTATQNATAATQAADQAQGSAKEAVNRADTLASVVANLDNYKQVGTVSVTFAFDKSVLNKDDNILEVTGGTDSVGNADYNYQLSQRRAEAVVQYLAAKFNVPAHKFYLIGIGKDQEVATNKTAAGRAQNRRVEVQILSNAAQTGAPAVSEVR
jgi:outer membrane protein OmpA-like peptidoglycan-associated protein